MLQNPKEDQNIFPKAWSENGSLQQWFCFSQGRDKLSAGVGRHSALDGARAGISKLDDEPSAGIVRVGSISLWP